MHPSLWLAIACPGSQAVKRMLWDCLQDMSLTSKYDHTHHSLPEPLLGLASLKSLSVRFPSLTSLQNGISRLTLLERLRIEGLQGTLLVEPGGPCPPSTDEEGTPVLGLLSEGLFRRSRCIHGDPSPLQPDAAPGAAS